MEARETIFANGGVFSGVRGAPWAEAVATLGADVVAVGDLAELRRELPRAVEHDLGRGTLLPGLVDAHNHFLSTGESLASIDLRFPRVDSGQALLRAIREASARAMPGETISGFGFDHGRYPLPGSATSMPPAATIRCTCSTRRVITSWSTLSCSARRASATRLRTRPVEGSIGTAAGT